MKNDFMHFLAWNLHFPSDFDEVHIRMFRIMWGIYGFIGVWTSNRECASILQNTIMQPLHMQVSPLHAEIFSLNSLVALQPLIEFGSIFQILAPKQNFPNLTDWKSKHSRMLLHCTSHEILDFVLSEHACIPCAKFWISVPFNCEDALYKIIPDCF